MEKGNQKQMKKETQSQIKEVRWGGILNEFLWTCAGVNKPILRQCPTDYAKYAGIGGTILFTAIMASLSGGYALFTVFDDSRIAIGFGILWGLLIFNLDRFIVNTMYSDGKVTISWQEFTSGLPRILMAIFLGIVISTPLELKIFEDEINVTIAEMRKARLEEYRAKTQHAIDSLSMKKEEVQHSAVSIYSGSITTSNQENNQLWNELHTKQQLQQNLNSKLSAINNRLVRARKQAYPNINYINLLTRQRNDLSMRIRMLANEISKIQGRIGANDATIKGLIKKGEENKEKQMDILQSQIDEKTSWLEKNGHEFEKLLNGQYKGFQARMLAFSKMKEDNDSTMIAATFIMLLFIIIETAPTFFKMMIASGPYDDLLRSEMHKARVLSDKRISDLNDEINTEITISTQRNEKRVEAEVLANEDLLKQLAKVQSEVLSVAIEKWREEELRKANENPSAYLHTSVAKD